MAIQELDRKFHRALREAIADPYGADLSQLWNSLETILEPLPCTERLQVAGQVIHDLAEVLQLRAEQLLNEWQDRNNTQGPIPDLDFLAGMVKQTMFLDVSDLVEPSKSQSRREGKPEGPADSIAGEVEKEAVLALVEQQEQDALRAITLAVAHEEDVSAWISAIRQYLSQQPDSVSLIDLQRSLEMPVVEVWLGLLLGGFGVSQTGGFFESLGLTIEPQKLFAESEG